MKIVLSNATLTHERAAREKAVTKRREFHRQASERDEDGEWVVPQSLYVRLDRRYKRRIQEVTENHRRKAKQISKRTGYFPQEANYESN